MGSNKEKSNIEKNHFLGAAILFSPTAHIHTRKITLSSHKNFLSSLFILMYARLLHPRPKLIFSFYCLSFIIIKVMKTIYPLSIQISIHYLSRFLSIHYLSKFLSIHYLSKFLSIHYLSKFTSIHYLSTIYPLSIKVSIHSTIYLGFYLYKYLSIYFIISI